MVLDILPVLIVIVLIAIVAVLVTGVVAMGSPEGPDSRFPPQFRNIMMRWRVGLQVLAVALVCILIFAPIY